VPRDDANQNKWKVLVIDEGAKKIIDNVIKEDDILNENITSEWNSGFGGRLKLTSSEILKESRRRGNRNQIPTLSTFLHQNLILWTA